MPTLSISIICRSILALLVGLTGWTLISPASVAAQSIDLSAPIPLQGYAWSAYTNSYGDQVGVGWISMSCESDPYCSDSDGYGVEVQTDGSLTGYARSNVGWIKFGGLSGFPTGYGTQPQNARLLPNGQLRGWARACTGTLGEDCSSNTMNPNTAPWDGFISLRGGGGGPSGYGIQFSTTQQPDGSYEIETGGRSGDRFAYGGLKVFGWIDFSQVTLGGTALPPTTPILTATDCVIPAGASSCDSSVQWNGPGFTNPRIQLNRGIGDLPGVGVTGNRNVTLTGNYSTYEARLYDGTALERTDTISVSCASGSSWQGGASGSCVLDGADKPDLILQNFGDNVGSYNQVTGEYSDVEFLFRINNIGATTTAYEGESAVEWDVEYTESVWPSNGTVDDSTPAIMDGSSRQVVADVGTLRFGIYDFTAEADRPDDIDEIIEGNNTGSAQVTLLPQDPDMVLTAVNSQIIRSGDQAEIEWDTVAEYPMTCTLSGPGIATQTFDPSIAGTSGSITTDARYNTSIYTLTCDVDYPGIDATFNAATRLEVIPRLEEI